jgi:aspartate racemase
MKKVGIIGGVGPQATAFIYQQLINVAQDQYGAKDNADYPDVIFASVPVPDFISDKDNIEQAKQMLVTAAKGLESAGCQALCIGSNTVHILLDDLASTVNVPFISMVELVAKRCKQLCFSNVALLGMPILLESELYDKALTARGINLIKPSPNQI